MANYNPTTQQYQQFAGAPPDIEQGALDLFQRQQLAQMLMQRGMEPSGGTEYTHSGGGQWAAPPQAIKQGWAQGLAKLAQTGVGAYMQSKIGDEQKALAEQLKTRRGQALQDVLAAQGSPAMPQAPMGPPTEEGQYGIQEAKPAISQQQAMAKALMGSEFGDMQAEGLRMTLNPPKHEFVHAKQGESVNQVMPDGTLREVMKVPEKVPYETTPPQQILYELAKKEGFSGTFMDFQKATAQNTHIHNTTPSMPVVAVNPETKLPQYVSREFAIANKWVPASVDAGVQGGISQAKTEGVGKGTASVLSATDKASAAKSLKAAGYDPSSGKDIVSDLLDKATGGMVGQGVDAVLGAANITTAGKAANASLETLANTIVMDMMGGKLGSGISNADRDFITAQLGKVADSGQPIGARKAAWKTAKDRLISVGVPMDGTKAISPSPSGYDAGKEARYQAWLAKQPK